VHSFKHNGCGVHTRQQLISSYFRLGGSSVVTARVGEDQLSRFLRLALCCPFVRPEVSRALQREMSDSPSQRSSVWRARRIFAELLASFELAARPQQTWPEGVIAQKVANSSARLKL
jgi:hypothetical protein